MSLLRLLTSGKSLVGLKQPESRYQLPGGRALPSFGSKKNPFRATVFPEKPDNAPTNHKPAEQSPVPVPVAAAGQAGHKGERSPKKDGPARSPAAELNNKEGTKSQLKPSESPASGRTSAFRALLLWGRAKKVGAGGSGSNRPLIQGELSLDRVKVIRNDLSESDLEVVQVERSAVQSAAPKRPAEPKESASEVAWGAGVSGLLGMSKS